MMSDELEFIGMDLEKALSGQPRPTLPHFRIPLWTRTSASLRVRMLPVLRRKEQILESSFKGSGLPSTFLPKTV